MMQSSVSSSMSSTQDNTIIARGVWSEDEHNRFLEALKRYPQGPWKAVTEYIGTRSIRQVQTHAQKYQEKVLRHARGLKTSHPRTIKRDHRIDEEVEQWWTRESAMLTGSPTHPRAVSRRRKLLPTDEMRNSMDSCECEEQRRGSLTSSTDVKMEDEDAEEDGEDMSDEDDRLYEGEAWNFGGSSANFEPLPLQFERAAALPLLPTLEECLAVVNECLVETASSANTSAYVGRGAVGIII